MFDQLFNLLLIGGLPILFILILLEGNPIVGSFIPGQIILLLVGVLLATRDIYNIKILFIIVVISAFLGDFVGYLMGKYLNPIYLEKLGLTKKSVVYKSSYRFFNKFGAWSLILGREFNLTRAFIPFFAGYFKMPIYKFIPIAIFSSILWTSLSLYLGFSFGYIILDKFKFISYFSIFLVFYIGLLYFLYRSFKNIYIKNYFLFKDYAISEIIFLFISLISFLIFSFLNLFNYVDLINSSFNFCFIPFFSNFSFLISLEFSLFILSIIFIFLILKKSLKLFLIYSWSFLLSLVLLLIISTILKKWFLVVPILNLSILTLLIFFLCILISNYKFVKKNKKYFRIFVISLLFLVLLVRYSIFNDIYLTILSFLISAFISQILLFLSHYDLIDNHFIKNLN